MASDDTDPDFSSEDSPLPAKPSSDDESCASILIEALRHQPGLRGIAVDPERGELNLRYDPEVLSPKRIEALAGELGALLDGSRDSCDRLTGGMTCRECPDFVDSEAHGLKGVRWLRGSGTLVGIELDGPNAGLQDFTVNTRRLRPSLTRWISGRGLLEALPVVLCGLFLAAGWLIESLKVGDGLLLYILACLAGGLPTAWSTAQSLLERKLDVDFLMLLGACGAAIIGHWDESGMLLFLFTLSSTLESFAMGRTRRAVESLMAMRPDETTVIRGGRHQRIPVEEVEVGECVAVRPGERVPLDGRVVEGEADVDESASPASGCPAPRVPARR